MVRSQMLSFGLAVWNKKDDPNDAFACMEDDESCVSGLDQFTNVPGGEEAAKLADNTVSSQGNGKTLTQRLSSSLVERFSMSPMKKPRGPVDRTHFDAQSESEGGNDLQGNAVRKEPASPYHSSRTSGNLDYAKAMYTSRRAESISPTSRRLSLLPPPSLLNLVSPVRRTHSDSTLSVSTPSGRRGQLLAAPSMMDVAQHVAPSPQRSKSELIGKYEAQSLGLSEGGGAPVSKMEPKKPSLLDHRKLKQISDVIMRRRARTLMTADEKTKKSGSTSEQESEQVGESRGTQTDCDEIPIPESNIPVENINHDSLLGHQRSEPTPNRRQHLLAAPSLIDLGSPVETAQSYSMLSISASSNQRHHLAAPNLLNINQPSPRNEREPESIANVSSLELSGQPKSIGVDSGNWTQLPEVTLNSRSRSKSITYESSDVKERAISSKRKERRTPNRTRSLDIVNVGSLLQKRNAPGKTISENSILGGRGGLGCSHSQTPKKERHRSNSEPIQHDKESVSTPTSRKARYQEKSRRAERSSLRGTSIVKSSHSAKSKLEAVQSETAAPPRESRGEIKVVQKGPSDRTKSKSRSTSAPVERAQIAKKAFHQGARSRSKARQSQVEPHYRTKEELKSTAKPSVDRTRRDSRSVSVPVNRGAKREKRLNKRNESSDNRPDEKSSESTHHRSRHLLPSRREASDTSDEKYLPKCDTKDTRSISVPRRAIMNIDNNPTHEKNRKRRSAEYSSRKTRSISAAPEYRQSVPRVHPSHDKAVRRRSTEHGEKQIRSASATVEGRRSRLVDDNLPREDSSKIRSAEHASRHIRKLSVSRSEHRRNVDVTGKLLLNELVTSGAENGIKKHSYTSALSEDFVCRSVSDTNIPDPGKRDQGVTSNTAKSEADSDQGAVVSSSEEQSSSILPNSPTPQSRKTLQTLVHSPNRIHMASRERGTRSVVTDAGLLVSRTPLKTTLDGLMKRDSTPNSPCRTNSCDSSDAGRSAATSPVTSAAKILHSRRIKQNRRTIRDKYIPKAGSPSSPRRTSRPTRDSGRNNESRDKASVRSQPSTQKANSVVSKLREEMEARLHPPRDETPTTRGQKAPSSRPRTREIEGTDKKSPTSVLRVAKNMEILHQRPESDDHREKMDASAGTTVIEESNCNGQPAVAIQLYITAAEDSGDQKLTVEFQDVPDVDFKDFI